MYSLDFGFLLLSLPNRPHYYSDALVTNSCDHIFNKLDVLPKLWKQDSKLVIRHLVDRVSAIIGTIYHLNVFHGLPGLTFPPGDILSYPPPGFDVPHIGGPFWILV